MVVVSINAHSEFESLKSSSQLLIVDFYATWCGPCKAIAPTFDKLANETGNKGATFARVDVDQVKSVAQACSITAMPTFVFFVKGEKKDELKGSDRHALETKIKKHVAEIGSGSSASSVVRGMISLNSKLDIKQLELLNATDTSSVRDLFDPTSKKAVESDSDEQLMIYATFQEVVKAHSVVLRVQVEKLDSAPSKFRIYVNRPNILSFEDVDSIPATQVVEDIKYDDKGQAIIALRFVKFQKVNNMVIFVEQNARSSDITSLLSLEILGEVSATNSTGVVQKIDHEHD